MDRALPPIYFYIRRDQLDEHIPNCADEYWQWRISMSKKYHPLGKFDWTLQTYLHLKDKDFPCELAMTPPPKGIVIAHSDFLDDIKRPVHSKLIVCLKSDRLPHTCAQVHIVQNPEDKVEKTQVQFVNSFYIPHWVQPLLISRNKKRAQKFENIAYFGSDIELAEEFKNKSWQQVLKGRGFNWILAISPDKWSDYSKIDALVAIRKCNSKGREFNFKPATKLYNAWHAGIPAILGLESAYIAERRSELDYIEANSPEEVISALERLRNDFELREKMLRNGKIRAEETKPEMLVIKWEDFLMNVASPAYLRWSRSVWLRRKYFLIRLVRKGFSLIKNRIFKRLIISQGY